MPTVTSKDGTRIAYDITGEGPAIVFVAGATQHRLVDEGTPKVAKLLAGRFTSIIYDRRGRGDSGDTKPYAVAREIEDIAALVAAVGGRASLFGMSSGAALSLEAAASGLNIDKIVAYEPPIDPDTKSADTWKGVAEMDAMAAKGQGEAMMAKFMGEVGMPEDDLKGFMQSPAWPAFAAVGHTIAYDYRILAGATDGDRLPERWKSIKAKVTVMTGDQTFPFMLAGADWIAKTVPGARRESLPGQSHEYDPAVMAPALARIFGG